MRFTFQSPLRWSSLLQLYGMVKFSIQFASIEAQLEQIHLSNSKKCLYSLSNKFDLIKTFFNKCGMNSRK